MELIIFFRLPVVMHEIIKWLIRGLCLLLAVGVPMQFVSGQESEKTKLIHTLRMAFPDRTGNQIDVLSFVRAREVKQSPAIRSADDVTLHEIRNLPDDSWSFFQFSRVAIPKEIIPARKATYIRFLQPNGKQEFSVLERQYRANEILQAKGGLADLELKLPLGEMPESVLNPESLWLSGALYAKKYKSSQPTVANTIFEEILIESVFFGMFNSDGVVTSIHSPEFAKSCVVVEGEGSGDRILKNDLARLEFRFRDGKLQGWSDQEQYENDSWIVDYRVETTGKFNEVTAFTSGRRSDPDRSRIVLEGTVPISNEDLRLWTAFRIKDGVKVQKEGDKRPSYALVNGEICTPIDPVAEKLVETELSKNSDNSQHSSDKSDIGFARLEHLNSSASSTHCGIYALAWCGARRGVRIPLTEIVNPKYLSSEHGSTISDLQRAANDFGLSIESVSNASIDLLRSFRGPAILHFKNADGDGGHWIAIDGFAEDGNALIVDLPNDRIAISPAELMTYWDSVALLVSRNGESNELSNASWLFLRFQQALPLGLMLVLLIGLRRFTPHKGESFWFNTLILSAFSAVIAVTWSYVNEFSYFNNPQAVRLASAKSVGTSDTLQIHRSRERLFGTNVQLIDSRKSPDFSRGKIGDAINLPINCRLGQFLKVTANLNKEYPTVVYCMSSRCRWSDQIATRLELLGFKNVSVYRPGYVGYTTQDHQSVELHQPDYIKK